jgi:tripartite-type tricarboxylate transporter receptor subunit TctC
MGNLIRASGRSVALIGLAALVGLVGSGWAQDRGAQDFPSRTIRIVVGFTPGGAPDVTARILAQKISEIWQQPVVVENRPGAGSAVAAQYVANASADGYTLLSVTNAHAIAPAINSQLPYDTLRDFASVTMTSRAPSWILASPLLGVKTLNELVALAHQKPDQLNYASAGIGSSMHFGAALFNDLAKIKAQHIPFRGVPEALTEAVTGRVQYVFSPIGASSALVRDGRLAALGITGKSRIPEFPDVPTMSEAGYPDFDLMTWTGLIAPARTPPSIITKLNQQIAALLQLPDVKARWSAIGIEPAPTTPGEFDKVISDEVATFTKAALAANISVK